MVDEITGRLLPSTLLVRRLVAPDGPAEAVVDFDPRLGEGRHRPHGERPGSVLVCSWPAVAVALQATPTVAIEAGRPRPWSSRRTNL